MDMKFGKETKWLNHSYDDAYQKNIKEQNLSWIRISVNDQQTTIMKTLWHSSAVQLPFQTGNN